VRPVVTVTADSLFLNAPVHRTVPAGEVIYVEGEEGTHMYGVVSGVVELRKGGAVVAILGPNDVFGERALIDRLPRNLSAVAVEETTLAEIDRGLFLFLVHETPTFALGIMGALATRLRDYDELFGRSLGSGAAHPER
jgi:CRP/FNR family cyclic AMP-dependent transcriptional regulator